MISACAMRHNVLKIRPPLVLSANQAGLVIQALDESLVEAQVDRAVSTFTRPRARVVRLRDSRSTPSVPVAA
jgi:hypothetical protein